MDVDLSTDLDALLPLVAPLVSGHSDVAIGTRLASTAQVSRGPRREAVSRAYNLILRAALHAGFSDAQCGFKAVRTDVAKALLPMVQDQGWFFDTELLVLAEHNGMRIHEVPVDWVGRSRTPGCTIASTARDDLRGVWRLMRSFARGEGVLPAPLHRRAAGGQAPDAGAARPLRVDRRGVSTVVFAALFLLLHGAVGPVAADVIALGVCTVVNTAANRRLTFNLRGRTRRVRHQLRGLVAALLPLALNLIALGIAAAFGITEAVPLVLVLTVANAVASLAKFVLLQHWVFVARPTAVSLRIAPRRRSLTAAADHRSWIMFGFVQPTLVRPFAALAACWPERSRLFGFATYSVYARRQTSGSTRAAVPPPLPDALADDGTQVRAAGRSRPAAGGERPQRPGPFDTYAVLLDADGTVVPRAPARSPPPSPTCRPRSGPASTTSTSARPTAPATGGRSPRPSPTARSCSSPSRRPTRRAPSTG